MQIQVQASPLVLFSKKLYLPIRLKYGVYVYISCDMREGVRAF